MDAKKENMPAFLLRTGLALAFWYAAAAAALEPANWIGFFPQWLRAIFPANILLVGFSVYQFVLGLWLMLRIRVFYAAVVSAATIFAILFFNISALDVVFRDIPILFAALALVFMARSTEARGSHSAEARGKRR